MVPIITGRSERAHSLYFWSFQKQNREVGDRTTTIHLSRLKHSPQTTSTPPDPHLYHTQ